MNRRQLLAWATLVAVVFALPLTPISGAEKKAKVLYFSRSQGFEHAPVKLQEDGTTVSGVALKKYCDAKNIELVCTQDGRVFDGDINQYDAFVFYSSGNLEDEEKSKNPTAHAISADGLKKLFATVKSGKGFVGIHSATDSHCNQKDEQGADLYTRFVGARFSGHGPQQFATVTITEPTQVPHLKDSGKRFTTWEEWYTNKDHNPDMHVLLVLETAEMDGKDYNRAPIPAVWIRKDGNGRIAYSCFGHDNRYWQNAENVRRIGELIEWSVGRGELDTTPNFDKVTPKGNELSK